MQLFLELTFEEKKATILVDDDYITIGRSDKCTYPIPDASLSSNHCKMYIKDEILYIEDLQSKNGVILNGIKIFKQKVYTNDIINIGNCTLRVDQSKLSSEATQILKTNIKKEDRSLILELEQPALNKKKPGLSLQNKKLYNGLNSLERKKNTRTKLSTKAELLRVVKVLIYLVIFMIAYKLLS